MIRNSRQLKVAETRVRRLKEDLESVAPQDRASYERLLDDVQAEIAEYLAITNGDIRSFPTVDVAELPELLVKARLATGLTQAQLAACLGITQQMVQKDEAGGYAVAGLDRLVDVIDALGYRFEGCLIPAAEDSWLLSTTASSTSISLYVDGADETPESRVTLTVSALARGVTCA